MNLSFGQQLLLTIVDKLIIAGALVWVGYLLNRRLEELKSAEATRLQELRGQQEVALQMRKEQQELASQIRSEQQLLQKEVRDLQAQKELQIAAARLPAYQEIFEIQEDSGESTASKFSPELREDLQRRLRVAYFHRGNGLYLTPKGMQWYRTAMACLKDNAATDSEIRAAFTRFRRPLKIDLKSYNGDDGTTPTDPIPPHLIGKQ